MVSCEGFKNHPPTTTMLPTIHGHSKNLEYLQRIIDQEDVPSALLFYGEEGVGKHTTARAVARLLNCKGTKTSDCTCDSCQKIRSGDHLDVFEYEPDGDTFKIAQVRELVSESDHSRMEGRWRIFILDRADKLNPQAADALLKTLEEGRKNTLFILLASSRKDIVPTLVSRTLDLYFGLLSEDEVEAALRDVDLYKGREAEVAVHLSGGSVSQACYFLQGDGFQIRNAAFGIVSGYPLIKDHRVLQIVDDHEESLPELVEAVYDLFSDLCLLAEGQDGFIRNVDIQDQLSDLSSQFGRKCFNAFTLVRTLRQKLSEPVAYVHQIKSTFLSIKDELR